MTIAVAAQSRSPMSQSALADMLLVADASMVHMIDGLVGAGLVMRERSKTDRRVKRILLTDAGHRVHSNTAAAVVPPCCHEPSPLVCWQASREPLILMASDFRFPKNEKRVGCAIRGLMVSTNALLALGGVSRCGRLPSRVRG